MTIVRPRVAGLLLVAVSAMGAPLAGQPIGSEFRVNTFTAGIQRLPAVATDASGRFVVAWGSYLQDGNLFGIYAQRYDAAGTPLGGEFRVNTYTTQDQFGPAIASDSAGNFVVVWQSNFQDGDTEGVFAQRYASSGAPLGGEFRVNTYTTNLQSTVAVAAAAASFVVVWEGYGQDGSSGGIFAQRYASSGAPLGAEFPVNTTTGNTQRRPGVASDASGAFVVVWESNGQDGSGFGIIGRRYDAAGAPLGGEFLVNTTVVGQQYEASVSSNPAGAFVVVWAASGQDGSSTGVFGRRYDSTGAAIGAEFRLNSYTTFGQDGPSVSMASNGAFVAVWNSYSQDGSGFGVYGQRVGSSGAPVDPEFAVPEILSGNQTAEPRSVASDSAGNFVVAWSDQGGDGDSFGVFARRFCTPLSSVTIGVVGATTVASCETGGTATITEQGGGARTHQWAYRDSGMTIHLIAGQTGTTYVVNGADFTPPAPPGVYDLFCLTTPTSGCGVLTGSNEIPITVVADSSAPAVTPPAAATATQTLCQ